MTAPSPISGGTGDMLAKERARATFNNKMLQRLMMMARGMQVDKFRPLFAPAREGIEDDIYRSYADIHMMHMKRLAAAVKITRENPKFMAAHMKQQVRMMDMFEGDQHTSMGIHFTMFLTFVETQASEEQKKKWLFKARQARFFGAYAQTELGHGSNVRGIETTATYDKATQEFVIHSPTLTSLKWWPTGMYACTHGAVFARLILEGKDYGFHGFLVQFRDDEGRLMPGVEVGEIGPKIAKKNTNIGYARFTHVRIPLFNMFAKSQQVTPDGKYIAAPPKLGKFKYISMMQIRMMIVAWAYNSTAKAATIAVRYSAVRKQGFKDSTVEGEAAFASGENTVLDYQVQQYRVFKATGLAWCFFFNAMFVRDYLARVQGDVMKGGKEAEAAAEELPALHATLAGLKAWSTLYGHASIEDCRKACGGQGYLMSSGMASLSTDFAEPATVEGEQVILSLQVARYLMKASQDVQDGKLLGESVAYLKNPRLAPVREESWVGRHDLLLSLFADRSSFYAHALRKSFQALQASGLTFDEALNKVANRAYKAAECHSSFRMLSNFHGALTSFIKDKATNAVLMRLLELLCLMLIKESAGDWIDVLDRTQLERIADRIDQLLAEIRPDAVALVDSFGIKDFELNSTLGRFDGNVYEDIYAKAKASSLNRSPTMVGWEHLKGVIDLDFLRAGMKEQRVAKL